MSYELFDKAASIQMKPTRKFVLAAIAYHADAHGVFRGGIGRIEQLCCASTRTVFSALRKLERDGLLTRQTMAGVGVEITLCPANWPGGTAR